MQNILWTLRHNQTRTKIIDNRCVFNVEFDIMVKRSHIAIPAGKQFNFLIKDKNHVTAL